MTDYRLLDLIMMRFLIYAMRQKKGPFGGLWWHDDMWGLWLKVITDLWSPGSISYESEDYYRSDDYYAELLERLDNPVCGEPEDYEKVCCDRDQIKATLQWSLKYFQILTICWGPLQADSVYCRVWGGSDGGGDGYYGVCHQSAGGEVVEERS